MEEKEGEDVGPVLTLEEMATCVGAFQREAADDLPEELSRSTLRSAMKTRIRQRVKEVEVEEEAMGPVARLHEMATCREGELFARYEQYLSPYYVLPDEFVKENDSAYYTIDCTVSAVNLHEYFDKTVLLSYQLRLSNLMVAGRGFPMHLILHFAARHDRADVIGPLLWFKAPINECGYRSQTALHIAATWGYADVIRALLRGRPNMDIRDRDRKTPLQIAVERGHVDAVVALLEGKPALKGYAIPSVLLVACQLGHLAIVEELLAARRLSELVDEYNTLELLHASAGYGQEMLRLVLDKCDAESVVSAARWAIQRGKKPFVSALLAADVSPDTANERGESLLHMAAASNRLEIAALLVCAGATVDLASKKGRTPLHAAALEGRYEVAALLLAEGAAVEALDAKRVTPLRLAAQRGHVETAKLLLEEGAGVDARDASDATPLFVAARHGHTQTVKALLAFGANVAAACADGKTPLFAAVKRGYEKTTKVLLAAGAGVDDASAKGKTPLYVAAKQRCMKVVHALLAAGARVDAATQSGRTPLFSAIDRGVVESVKLLLAAGAKVDAVNHEGRTPLFNATDRAVMEVMKLQLASGPEVEAATRSRQTPYFDAADQGFVELMTPLVFEPEAKVDATNQKGQVPLFTSEPEIGTATWSLRTPYFDMMEERLSEWVAQPIAPEEEVDAVNQVDRTTKRGAASHKDRTSKRGATERGHIELVRMLLAHGADVFVADGAGQTSLHSAAESGDMGVVELLLTNDADASTRDRRGLTPLDVASAEGHGKVVAALLDRTPALDAGSSSERKTTSLRMAIASGSVDTVSDMIKRGGSLRQVTSDGSTLLHLAARQGSADVIDLLCTHGAGAAVEAVDWRGRTPLHNAVGSNHVEAATALLACGARVDVVDADGWNPLHFAALQKGDAMMKLLLADATFVTLVNSASADELRVTPLYTAVLSGDCDVVALLLKSGADANAAAANGATPLYAAVVTGNTSAAYLLLKNGADASAAAADGATPMLAATRGAHVSLMSKLLKKGASVNAATVRGDTSLRAAADCGNGYEAFFLLRNGASWNASIVGGVTPLHIAASRGHFKVVRFMIQYHVDTGGCSGDGATTRDDASGSPPAAAGGNQRRPVHHTSGERVGVGDDGRGNPCDAALVDAVDDDGYTPVLSAARSGHLDVVKLLLQGGASACSVANDGETLLTLTADWRSEDAFALLDSAGCLTPFKALSSDRGSLVSLTLQSLKTFGARVHEFQELWRRMVEGLLGIYHQLSLRPSRAELSSFVAAVFRVAQLRSVCSSSCVIKRLTAMPSILERFRSLRVDLAALESLPELLLRGDGRSSQRDSDDEADLLRRFASSRRELEDALAVRKSWDVVRDEHDPLARATALRHFVRAHAKSMSASVLAMMAGFLDTFEIYCSDDAQPLAWCIPPHDLRLECMVHGAAPADTLSHVRSVGEWGELSVTTTTHYVPAEQFIRGVDVCFPLAHPHVAKLHGASLLSTPFVAVFERVQSVSFTDFLELKRKTGKRRLFLRMYEVALGLRHLADNGILVDCLRGEHVWVTEDERVKIDALGACIAVRGAGCLDWRAPEVVRGGAASTASVVYALGMCFLEVLTSGTPWLCENNSEVASDAMRRFLPRLPAFPNGMDHPERSFVASLCRPDPAMRPPLSRVIATLKAFANIEAREERRRKKYDIHRELDCYRSWVAALDLREDF